MKSKKYEKYSYPALKERGWTKKMVDELLKNIEPELVENPHYKCAAPMKLYEAKDIKRIERTKKFKEMLEKANKRRISAQKAVETKIKNTMEEMEQFAVEVKRIDIEDLKNRALSSKQSWYRRTGQDFKYDYDAYTADEETIKRWMVNFIRHHLSSDYDYQVYSLSGKTGVNEAYKKYKENLAHEMKKVYPELEKEIDKYMLNIGNEEPQYF